MIGGDREIEGKFQTSNLKLAAALLVMGFQLSRQPFIEYEGQTVIHFVPEKKWDGMEDGQLICNDMEAAWDQCVTQDEPELPAKVAKILAAMPWLVWMRKALVARDYVLTVNLPSSGESTLGAILTTEPHFAATLIAMGFPLAAKKDKRYWIVALDGMVEAWRALQCPIPEMLWMKTVLSQQSVLAQRIREAKQRKLVRVDGPDKKFAILSNQMSPEGIRQILKKLHERE